MTGSRQQGWSVAGWTLTLLLAGASAFAQGVDPLQDESSLVHAQQMPRDYQVLSLFSQVERNLASKTDEGRELLADQIQELLDQPYDYFLLKDLVVDAGLRSRIDSVMRSAPAEFRDQYDRRFNAEARELLDRAVQAGDQRGLLEVIRRFAWTASGRRAKELLAMLYSEQGEMARAARTLEELLTFPGVVAGRPELVVAAARYARAAGDDAAALRVLDVLKGSFGESVPLQGKTVPLFSDSGDALAWLEKQAGGTRPLHPPLQTAWLSARGSDSGTVDAAAASPLAAGAWKAPLLDGFDIDPIFPQDAKVQESLKELQKAMEVRERKFVDANHLRRPLAPAGSPLLIGQTVVVSGPASIKAYDAATGRFLWTTVEIDNTFQTLYRLANQSASSLAYRRLLDAFFTQRMWINRNAGQLSSDGEYVYAVVDTQLMVAPRGMPFGPVIPRNAPPLRGDNRLVAFELATDGTIRWSMGGRPPAQGPLDAAALNPQGSIGETLPGLIGAYFLGVPLPADGVLYVLAEDRGQVKLFALDPRPDTPRGRVLWSLPLLNPTSNSHLQDNVGRRMGGMTPVMHGGLLVCELMDGVVTAVDPAQRRVVWTRRYRPADPPTPRNVFIMQAMNAAQQGEEVVVEEQLRAIGWWDTNPVLVADAVLLTPYDDDRLHGFRLSTGEPLWPSVPRGEGLYVIAADADRFILVENRAIEARETATGKTIWRRPLEAPGVSGRGLKQGDRLTVPLGTGELLTLDLRSGQILAQSPMPPNIRSANLIAADGQIVLQTATGVTGYPSLGRLKKEIDARLAEAPDDVKALAERGALRLHQGQIPEGQADLRTALQAGPPNLAARRMLVWSLLADLRADFEKARPTLDELNRLATDADQKFWLHLTTADGLKQSGDHVGALREYFRIPLHAGTEDLESGLTVAKPRWVRGKVEDILQSAPDPELLTRELESLLKQTADFEASAIALQRLGLRRGVERALLSRTPPAAGDSERLQREREQELWWIWTRGAEPFRLEAAARIAPLWLGRGMSEPVVDLLDDLAAAGPQGIGSAGKTGPEILKAWEEDPALSGPLRVRPRWDKAAVEIDPPTDTPISGRFLPILVRGSTAGPLDGSTFLISLDGQRLSARDRFGSDSRLDVSTVIEQGNGIFQSRYINTLGRLVIYVSTDQFQIIDSVTNQTIAREFLVDRAQLQSFGNPRGRSIVPDELQEGIRGPLIPGISPGSFAGNVGQPTWTSFCYQRGDQLYCLDPSTGELQWTRAGVPEGSEILMDDDYVVLCPPLTQELLIHRTVDGRHVGRASVPKDVVRSRRGAEWGRLLLTAKVDPGSVTYGMFDPVKGAAVWSRKFAAGTEWTSADGENIAFLSPDGAFEIVRFETGETLSKAALSPIPKLDGFLIRRDGNRMAVLTWLYGNPAVRGRMQKSDPRTREVHPQGQLRHFESFERTEFSGPLFLIDDKGEVLWERGAPKYRSLFVSNTVPTRWPVLAVVEEHESLTDGSAGWNWSLDIIDPRSGKVLRSDMSTDKLRGKEYFIWRTDALNRLSLCYSGKTYPIRLMGQPAMEEEPPPPQDEEKKLKPAPAPPKGDREAIREI